MTHMTARRRGATGFFLSLAAFAMIVFLASAPAYAQSLDDMRASGAIAERYDGFVMVKSGAPGAAALVEQVNAKRRGIYEARAAQRGISVDRVGKFYAKKIRGRAPKGTYFLGADGGWSRK